MVRIKFKPIKEMYVVNTCANIFNLNIKCVSSHNVSICWLKNKNDLGGDIAVSNITPNISKLRSQWLRL